MKKGHSHPIKTIFGLLQLVLLFACSSPAEIPSAYLGKWTSSRTQIEIRSKISWMKYAFVRDSVLISLDITSNTISGSIGNATFTGATIKKNHSLPLLPNDVAYIITCGSIAFISEHDTLPQKKVELWILKSKSPDLMEAELRQTDLCDAFPMAHINFHRP